jgi:hypothetical protein
MTSDLCVLVVCAGMDDYLSWTLPHNLRALEPARYLVVHPEGDDAVEGMARRHGAGTLAVSGCVEPGVFRKGRMVSAGVARLKEQGAGWIMHLDCDIAAPLGLGTMLHALLPRLDAQTLYFSSRFGVERVEDIPEAMEAIESGSTVEAMLSRFQGRLHDWQDTPPRQQGPFNVCPWGFLQLFHADASALDDGYSATSEDAGGDDANTAKAFSPRLAILPQPQASCLHLPHGESQANWHGRTTARIVPRGAASLSRPPGESAMRSAPLDIFTPVSPATDPRLVAARRSVDKALGLGVAEDRLGHLRLEEWFDLMLVDSRAETVLFMDVDCVPTDRGVVMAAEEWARMHGSFIGLAQASNHLRPNDHIYACPAFLCIHRPAWEALGRPSIRPWRGGDYADKLCRDARSMGLRYRAIYPSHWEEEPVEGAWHLHNYGIYGVGTHYPFASGGIYHLQQSRMNTHVELFETRCRQIVDGTFSTDGMRRCVDDYDGRIVP